MPTRCTTTSSISGLRFWSLTIGLLFVWTLTIGNASFVSAATVYLGDITPLAAPKRFLSNKADQCVKRVLESNIKTIDAREKRSVPQLEWFTDITSSLIRPAPLGGRRHVHDPKQFVETQNVQEKGSLGKMDRSWFTDNTKILLRPAPLYHQNDNIDVIEETSIDTPVKLAELVKTTIRSISGHSVKSDISDTIRENIMSQSHPFIPSNLKTFNLVAKSPSKGFASVLHKNSYRDMYMSEIDKPIYNHEPQKKSDKIPLPWFRPVRFLQRVKEAINEPTF